MKLLDAHFDGKHIVLDQPAQLELNARVKVLAPDLDETDEETIKSCAHLSESVFSRIWDNPLDADYDKL